MYLTIWDSIRDYLQNSISIGGLFALLVGILVGMLIAFIIYLVLVTKSIKESAKDYTEEIKNTDSEEEKKNQVIEYIENSISRYDDVCKGKELGEKYTEVKDIVVTLVTDIAKTYYPDSKHPLAELTIEEVVALDRYIVDRIESIFQKKALKIFYKRKVSQGLNLLDKKKEIEENKIIKQAKKYHAQDIFKTINNIVQAINPAYWAKKGIVNVSLSVGSNYIFRAIIRIIGSETAKIYSKNVFIVDEDKINEEIDNVGENIIDDNE